SMLGRITIQTFNFDESFQAYRSNDFAWDFFQDPCLKNNLKANNGFSPIHRITVDCATHLQQIMSRHLLTSLLIYLKGMCMSYTIHRGVSMK
ncbi:hypothetical protein cypCar_00033395, partial [Cyprinus carpio]